MPIIENFADISVQEQFKFAEELIAEINSKRVFSTETDFKLDKVEADDLTGELIIQASHSDPIDVPRKAQWTCYSEDEVELDPKYRADYYNPDEEDIKKAFDKIDAVLGDYKVTLEISDFDEVRSTAEVEVDRISYGDDGIGRYEYCGTIGYDSQPYVRVRGTIIRKYDCYIAFVVAPNTDTQIDPEEL